jgi:hypothetical protein
VAEGTARGLPLDKRSGWAKPTSYEVMKMKAINHKLMIRLKEKLPFKAVRMSAAVT